MEITKVKANKGGRPKCKNALEKIAPSRFSMAEYETIKAKAIILKISVSTYIRSMTLQGNVRNIYSEEEQNAKRQLIGMANNLNQLMKSVNMYGLENLELQVKMQLNEIDKILENTRMVAIVSQKGMMFKGLINYLYEGKLADRGVANKQAEVIIHSDNIRIPYGVEDEIGRKRLIDDFIDQAKSHRNYGDNTTKYVGEHILSFKTGEIERLGKAKIKELCEQYVKDAGIDATQYIAVSHGDTDIFHIHIVFNRSQNDRTLYPEWKEKMKAAERAVAISLKYGLELTGNQEKLANTKGVREARIKHQDIIDLSQNPVLKNVRNLIHLEKRCEAQKIYLSSNENRITVGKQTFLKRDLEVIFFMNRQESTKSEQKKSDKTQEIKYNREKKDRTPAHKLKKSKVEKNQDEREKKQSECNELIDLIPFTNYVVEGIQDFSYRKAWGKNDKDENTIMRRRKKW